MERDLRFFPADPNHARTLSCEQIEQFNEQGFLVPFTIFEGEQVQTNRQYFENLMDQVLQADDGRDAYSINGYQSTCRGLYDLCVNEKILDLVEDIIGPDIVCWGAHYFCKLPGDMKQVSWHQDAVYWPLTPSKTVTAWLAIDDSDRENGAMRVIPGTHRRGPLEKRKTESEDNNVLTETIIDPDQYGPPASLEMKAGQISLHSDLLVHGSEPNPSTRRRGGLTIRYCSTDVRGEWNDRSIICRGNDPSGHWTDIPRPTTDDPRPRDWQAAG